MANSKTPANSGMALIAVMTALVVLSAIAATMAVSIQTEARMANADFASLQAEELARSGQEFAQFLQSRGLGTNPDFLAGLPFEAVVPGFHYRARTEMGVVEIYFEADNGKINPSTAPPELISSFLGLWTGDLGRAQVITESIGDWFDSDKEARPNGAEDVFYAGRNVSPRNATLGVADLPFVRGMGAEDFRLKLSGGNRQAQIRQTLDSYMAESGGAVINLNFAPELVLQAIPGLTSSQVASFLAARRERPFENMSAVANRTGISSESPARRYLTVSPSSPTVLTIAKLAATGLVRSERRVSYSFSSINFLSGSLDSKSTVGRIEKNVFPDFL